MGYLGSMNLGWVAGDRDSRYVVFINNDLIIKPLCTTLVKGLFIIDVYAHLTLLVEWFIWAVNDY